MSPRDQFAAAALTGILAGTPRPGVPDDQIVQLAYRLADEMVRQQKPEPGNVFELACTVADIWMHHDMPDHVVRGLGPVAKNLSAVLDCLHDATRTSMMRKVPP